ncbi:iron chelate uptake ABC transporter family permease subunit [Paenibacillus sp. FSL M7-0802]|jgi:iron complex transport system permease protein|uniref:FecCD family ABC transporter permease n=1 Tax=Paenibacillus TaxID=44249 RepID=UPI0008FB46F1|nr:iron chelate uptake ABC transporter family permease subunit [Paenibacillus polymyxa]APB77560.1 Fe(3+)-hydroxamate ABC transporter permease FhuB [Paenibacillus polymyxa]
MKKLWILLALMLGVAFIAIGVGSTYITPSELITALTDQNASSWFIVHHYRLPRGLLAIMAGAGLAVAGVLLQGMIRNPLASPDVVGVSKGAGFAAVLVIVLLPSSPVALLPVAAFVGAGLAALLLVQLSMKGGMRPNMLALTGLAVGAIFQAATDYILVKYPLEASDTLTWLAGSLWGKGWDEVYGLLPWLIVLLPLAYTLQRKLDIMSLDEESSAGLGLSVKRVRTGLLAVSVALAASCVAAIGSIGFIGLLAPHLARRLFGNRHRYLLPGSAMIGALILVLADALGRGLKPPLEIPAGIVTAVIGAPYFLYLLLRERKQKGSG